MTPAERAAWDRVLAGYRELEVAKAYLDMAAHDAAGAIRDLAATIQAMDFRMALDEAEEMATHPDLVEVNVTMDGWYGA